MDSSWEKIQPLLEELLELDPREVSQVLEERCAGDESLWRRLREFLSVDADSRWLEPPGSSGIGAALAGATRDPGDRGAEEQVGPYRLIRELGRGGQAVVHLAEDTRIEKRQVAIKLLTGTQVFSPTALERFRREAAVASKLAHPGICPVFEAGHDRTRPYIAMRYLEGETLAQRIRSATVTPVTEERPGSETRGRGPESSGESSSVVTSPSGPATRDAIFEIVSLAERAARALHAAHEAGIIHRDIKPGNIMITPDGEPVIMDFGLAREVDGETMTLAGDLFGTPPYMSPEQLATHHVRLDARTDVWSLGVTLFEALTLQRPFAAPTREGLFEAIKSEAPRDPQSLNGAIPTDLSVVVLTALEKDLDRRYQSALELAEDLRRVREYQPIAAQPASAWIKVKRWAQRNPVVALSISTAFLAITGGLVASLFLLAQRDDALTQKDAALQRYDQMSDVALVKDLREEAEALWPRRPEKAAAMKDWIARAREVYARLPEHEAALDALRERAREYDSRQQAEDAARRRVIHADLFDALAAGRRTLGEYDAHLSALEKQLGEITSRLDAEERESRVARLEQRREKTLEAMESVRSDRDTLEKTVESHEADPRLTQRLTWELGEATDRWRHEVLAEMVPALRTLGEVTLSDVEARLVFAESIRRRTVEAHAAAWARCTRDLAVNPRYADSPDLHSLAPQVGLVPLGIDRDSGLWEFWHLGSGERPRWDGADWVANPEADPRGKVKLDTKGADGIVLVLVPGGTQTIGATPEPGKTHHDPNAEKDEAPVGPVTLDGYFFGKHEMTQAQWLRLMGSNPSAYSIGSINHRGGTIPGSAPVTNVSWAQAGKAMTRLGLTLPTEARWERACRAETDTVFWCGADAASIQAAKAGNVADKTASAVAPWPCTREIEDGHVVQAPVGSFAPNPFGLHDVIGNVMEWCIDRYGPYDATPAEKDGLRDDPGARNRVARGGGYDLPALICRSSDRFGFDPSSTNVGLGLRPARSVE